MAKPSHPASGAQERTVSNGKGLTLNQKVLLWAQGKLGQQVGDRQCWTLCVA